jgi:hypothetical protein
MRAKSAVLIYLAVLSTVLLAVYWPSWNIEAYSDDLSLLIAVDEGIAGGAYAGEPMFRPLELFVLQLSYGLTGSAGLARAINFAAFVVSIGLVFRLALHLAPHAPAVPFLAAALFACHPVNVATVAQIDTVSQNLATLTVLGAFAWYLLAPQERPLLYHAGGAALAGLALLSKEVVVGPIFALPLALALVDLFARAQPAPAALRRGLVILAAMALIFIAYLGMRTLAGAVLVAEEDAPRYSLGRDPLAVVKNVALLLGSTAWLGSTIDLFLTGDPWRRAASAAASLAVNGLALAGLVLMLRDLCRGILGRAEAVMMGAVTLMMLSTVFPVALIGWPSEVHSFLPVPFYSLLVAVLAVRGGAALAATLRLPPRRAAALGLVGLLLVCAWMLVGVRQKIEYAAGVSARSEVFLEQMTAWYRSADTMPGMANACVLAPPERVYSIYAMSSYSLLQPIVDWLNHRLGPRLHLPVLPQMVVDCRVVIEVDGRELRLYEVGTR